MEDTEQSRILFQTYNLLITFGSMIHFDRLVKIAFKRILIRVVVYQIRIY